MTGMSGRRNDRRQRSFFKLGSSSLILVELAKRAQSTIEQRLPPTSSFQNQNMASSRSWDTAFAPYPPGCSTEGPAHQVGVAKGQGVIPSATKHPRARDPGLVVQIDLG